MSSEHRDFSNLMQQVSEGSEMATRELVVSYGTHLLRVVRKKLNPALRSKFDSQDFVQAVWASFFAFRPERYKFDQEEQLVAFLSEMAKNKVVEAVRQRMVSQKYNVNRECSLDGPTIPEEKPCIGNNPTPEEIAIAREEWERLLEDQTVHYRRILELLRGGHCRQDVARDLGLSEKTVYRVLRRLSPRLADESS